MNIIIAGCGKVGRALAEQLSREKHDITVIDRKPEAIQQITNIADVRGVVGNGASFEIQMDAGIDTADLMIAVTDADEVNLLCCLIAKKAGGCQTIARVRNPVYHHEIHHIKDELGLSMVINPEWAAAMEMARLLRFPSAIDIDTFANGRIELLRFQLEEQNPLCNNKIKDLHMLSRCDSFARVIPNCPNPMTAKDFPLILISFKICYESNGLSCGIMSSTDAIFYPIIIFSSARCTSLVRFCARDTTAAPSVSGPILPRYTVKIPINLAGVFRTAVSPLERPTVPIAEVSSYSTSTKGASGIIAKIPSTEISSTLTAIPTTTCAERI